MKLTAPQRRALDILDYATGDDGRRSGLTPTDFAHLMWPGADGWRRVSKCGPYGSRRGGGMVLGGGGYLGKLVKRGLARRVFGCRGSYRFEITDLGRNALRDLACDDECSRRHERNAFECRHGKRRTA